MGWIEKYSTFDHVLVVGMYWHLYSGLGLQIMLRCIALGRQRCVQTLTCGAHGCTVHSYLHTKVSLSTRATVSGFDALLNILAIVSYKYK